MSEQAHIDNWNAFKQGDKGAFERLYRAYADRLYAYGMKFSRSSEVVEDAIQDLFVELWEKRDRLANTDSVSKYLYVALRRKVLQVIDRKEKRYTSADQELFFGRLEDDNTDPGVDADGRYRQKARVKNQLPDLSSRQREAIYLKYYAGMDNEEIGEIMEMNDQSVRNLLSRALKALRKNLTTLVGLLFILFFG